jgi:hypothetical protein
MIRRRRTPGQYGPSATRLAGAGLPDLTSAQMVARQKEVINRTFQAAEQSFCERRAASNRRDWCNRVPQERKVDTVQSFLKAFHDEESVEIGTCSICYMKKRPQDLDHADWKRVICGEIRATMASLLVYQRCFPETDSQGIMPDLLHLSRRL